MYNQLKNELINNSWIIDNTDKSFFDWDVMKIWKNRLSIKEDKYKIWIDVLKILI